MRLGPIGLSYFVVAMGALCAQSAAEPARDPGVLELKVVGRRDELMSQPSVQVGKDEVKLGIEAMRCPAGTGVLFYCLQMNASKARTVGGKMRGEHLGPVWIKVVAVAGRQDQTADIIEESAVGDQEPLALFAAGAMVAGQGQYQVQIMGQDGKLIATRKIEATQDQPLPWLTLDPEKSGENVAQPQPDAYRVSDIPAMPRWGGRMAMAKVEELPRFFPTHEDAGLEVSEKDGEITVKSDRWLDGNVPNHWLIRWWINGKPVLKIDDAARPHIQRPEEKAMRLVGPTTFSFHLDETRKMLGANADDVLEFQLPYCHDGITFVGQGRNKMALDFQKNSTPVCLSKRLRW